MILIIYLVLFAGTVFAEKEFLVSNEISIKLVQLQNEHGESSPPHFLYGVGIFLAYVYIGTMALHYVQKSYSEKHMGKISFLVHLILISGGMGTACFTTMHYIHFFN